MGGGKRYFGSIFSFHIYDRDWWAWAATFYGIEKARSIVEISRVDRRENGRFPFKRNFKADFWKITKMEITWPKIILWRYWTRGAFHFRDFSEFSFEISLNYGKRPFSRRSTRDISTTDQAFSIPQKTAAQPHQLSYNAIYIKKMLSSCWIFW